ncbi:MAG: nucleoside recognition domain-containing protein [Clostridia bacterium]|nr:nucleoside recognition domain-containing protein [Clostridia bacterium]
MTASWFLPVLLLVAVLGGLRARIDVYEAFVRGAKEGLETVLRISPYLIAILTATALLRETGLMDRITQAATPFLERLGLPGEAVGVVLLRPLSGSAALAAVRDVMQTAGADSRAGRLACVICGASETVFFTSSLYLGAAGVRRSRYAIPAALLAYAAGVAAAALAT